MSLGPNLVANGAMGGGSAPSTLPFGWFFFTTNIGTVTHTLAYGTETGIPYVDIILTGTPGAGGSWQVVCGSTFSAGTLPVIPSGLYRFSANVKLQAGTWANVTPTLDIQEKDNSSTIRTDQLYVGQRTTDTLDVNAYAGSFRMAPTCVKMFGIFDLAFAAASAVSITVRFGAPEFRLDDGLQSGGAPRMMAWY